MKKEHWQLIGIILVFIMIGVPMLVIITGLAEYDCMVTFAVNTFKFCFITTSVMALFGVDII